MTASNKLRCLHCDFTGKNSGSLATHYGYKHSKIERNEEFWVKILSLEIKYCPCGKKAPFNLSRKEYYNFCRGHNNLGKKTWNKGLTKKTDERVAKNSLVTKQSIQKQWDDGHYKNRKSNAEKIKTNDNNIKTRFKKGLTPWNKGMGHPSCYDYENEFTEELRHFIRVRDKATCQVCGTKRKKLVVHHIDENKKNNTDNNLITLCQSCHMKEHMYIIKTEKRVRGFVDHRN